MMTVRAHQPHSNNCRFSHGRKSIRDIVTSTAVCSERERTESNCITSGAHSLSPPFSENRQTSIDHRLTHPAAGHHVFILNATQSSVASFIYDTIVDKNGGTRSSSHNGASGQATTCSITINLCYFVVDVGRCAIIATEDAND